MTLSTAVLRFLAFFAAYDDYVAQIASVMPGLDPGIHQSSRRVLRRGWIAGSSPAMTDAVWMPRPRHG
jgi:hypothetical protein